MPSTMNARELMERVRQGEDETIELKSSLQPPPIVAKYLASFANTKGGAIVFGVTEPATVVGVNEDAALSIIDRARALLSPQISVEVKTVKVDHHTLVIAEVARSQSPVAAQGAFFWRTGDQVRPLTPAEIKSRVTEGRSVEGALTELSSIVATQTKTIESLTEEFNKANSLWRKIAIAGGGAVVGAMAKHLFALWVA